MLTVAQIAAAVAAGTLGQMTEQTLSDASQSVIFALDPFHMGEEPHLVHRVDACGLAETELHALDQSLWAELATREDARHAAMRTRPLALAA